MSKNNNKLNYGQKASILKTLTGHKLFIPIAFLAFLLLLNVFINPGFLRISMGKDSAGNPVLRDQMLRSIESIPLPADLVCKVLDNVGLLRTYQGPRP